MNKQVKVMQLLVIGLLLVASISAGAAVRSPGDDIQSNVSYELVGTGPYGSRLFNILSSSVYDDPPQLIDLTAATAYQQGFDVGSLLGHQWVSNFNILMVYLLGDQWYEPLLARRLNAYLDRQWDEYLSLEVPAEFMDEFKGLTDGGRSVHAAMDVGKIAARATVISNFPGDLQNLKFIAEDEWSAASSSSVDGDSADMDMDKILQLLQIRWKGLSCSMFGVWGKRTMNGGVYTGRNLDWLSSTGVSVYKLVTVYHPPQGYPHATIGWAGLWGALTGMSSQGISVHEANLESDDITFRGFPWVLRLRHVMAHAKNIDEALSLWKQSNNTVGFNHGFGSKNDKQAVCLETMKGNSAIFSDDDPRERALVVDGRPIGAPRRDAVYRTNHGFDDYSVTHFMWNHSDPYNYSIARYMLFPALLDSYEALHTPITFTEAVYMAAVVGDKGEDRMYECEGDNSEASNILSVAYDLNDLIMYTAWENGLLDDGSYSPAACNTYLKLDMKPWFLSPTTAGGAMNS